MNPTNIGTRDIPIKLANAVSLKVKQALADGTLINAVTPVTRDLIKFWFLPPYTETRPVNFHEGQQQSILNIIYLHEVLRLKTVKDFYLTIAPDLLAEMNAAELVKTKYEIPKYAIKMATGTGKTWVMHALLIWQLLNAKYEETKTGNYTKNFLLVAPGLIVYERILDAYLGKENSNQERTFEQSDFYKFQDLFIPQAYKEDVFGFIQNNVVQKEEIGSKITGEGIIAITNWHLFMGSEDEIEETVSSPLDNPKSVIKDLFPILPGTSGGNDLSTLDNQYLRGKELDYLAGLNDLMVMNDEAHHIHENKSYGEVEEVEWQKGLNKIAENKGSSFIQVDFSATPYDVTGSGQTRTKHYFPHIISDFDLKVAIRKGLVKTIAIDKRKELSQLPLEFGAIRDTNNKVIGLSDGQILMLRAGLSKLKILEKHFTGFTQNKDGISDKHPKMLVVCEDTTVSPYVENFLMNEGLNVDDITRVDSNRSGEIPKSEWQVVKQKLFNVDKYAQPKVIISVLMLREGFDVNNICVIVPLRATTAPILLEQTIGRGLRLMWREKDYEDIKTESRRNLLELKKEPTSYLDLLTIVEHPAFIAFYDELLAEGLAGELDDEPETGGQVLGDLITVGLKDNYKDYDIFLPVIVQEAQEEMSPGNISISSLQSFTAYDLTQLQKILANDGEAFYSEELTVKTRFGNYVVSASLFTAQSYNEYLQKLLHTVTNRMEKVSERKTKPMPVMQINQMQVIQLLDKFIKEKLFNQSFNPFEDNNYKILLAQNGIVTDHIIKEIGKAIYEMQQHVDVTEAEVEKVWFSQVPEIKMRQKYALDITKTIYTHLAYPSNKGLFEKEFMLYADSDSEVISFLKIQEHQHPFVFITYIRNDGLISLYHPDFILVTNEKVYVIETKGQDKIKDENVKQKQLATLAWCSKINKVLPENRMGKIWEYILLSENHFYSYKTNGATITEICELAKVSEANVKGMLL